MATVSDCSYTMGLFLTDNDGQETITAVDLARRLVCHSKWHRKTESCNLSMCLDSHIISLRT